ncbi:helix-turn-helix domain-containing protein [Variovorax sp. PvP013]|jgi:cytoskeleton protein RodZ|uniref:helix-turn-helix domain-containing protein n=1 Tax=Variovorax sp. PvP013 TaxID=3156435 RepID=UPI003D232E7D
MIERASETGHAPAAPTMPVGGADRSAGTLLREAREAHNLHIDVVAAALKVPTQKLQALENDDIGALPDPVFARALAASVCRALRVDPAPVLAKLPGALKPGLADADQTISSSFRSGAPRSRGVAPGGRPSRALLAVVALLLIGVLLLWLLPPGAFGRLSAALPGGTPSTAVATDQPAAGESSTATTRPGMVTESVTTGAVLPSTPSNVAASAPAVVPAPAASAASGAAAGSVVASTDVLVFVARAPSWITVTEAGGRQLLRRSLQAGETVGLSGRLPMSVVVGRAASVDVSVRGQPFDLGPLTGSGGVARFEIKP